MEITQARLIRKIQLGPEIFAYTIESKTIAQKAQPGQFVQIRINDSFDPFLRRPFSIAQVWANTFQIVFRIRGKGTKILAQAKEEDYLDVLGPLGRPVPCYEEANIVMIGGGVGIAPLLFLAQKARPKNRLYLFFGARTRTELILQEDFKKLTKNIAVITEDGSTEKKGMVTDLLTTEELDRLKNPLVFACGPVAMLKALKRNFGFLSIYGFLEERLGCGTGLCFGCAVKKKNGGYLRICKDGPVVNLNEIEI
jgi:dihydroorotate dehydrogenase electron transfer subunit|uniref:Dihydroorotate dehydrogenase electron transfer subunit n=1 Tax=candidate division WOR-3 bacterium TaxID=2052148 RepID=A0A7C6EAH3_UNCW3